MEGISSISGILEKLAAIKLRRAGQAPAPHAAADDSPASVVLGHVGVHEFLGLDDGPSGSDWAPPLTMLAWLAADLAKAAAAPQRAAVPWIVLCAHVPMYASDGNNGGLILDVEPLLFEFGVDLHLVGHNHY